MLTQKYYKFVDLPELNELTDLEYNTALDICEKIKILIAKREAFASLDNIENKFIELGLGWDYRRKFYNSVKYILDGDYAVINNLRLFSQQFTGYQLISLSSSAGKIPPTNKIPDSLSELLGDKVLGDNSINLYQSIIKKLPTEFHLGAPRYFGEIGWDINGQLVNNDTCVYLERISLLYEAGLIYKLKEIKNPVVVEIGGGYGGLAYYIKKIIPNVQFVNVDIPESLLYAAIYLCIMFKSDIYYFFINHESALENINNKKMLFLSDLDFDILLEKNYHADLVINTLSMSEMTEVQVRRYCKGIAKLIGRNGFFFEQNQNNIHCGMLNASDIINEYFVKCTPIYSSIFNLTQGAAHIWMN
ncbi:MAG: putative sugar O-methyltransferase [Gammaproteobacteria bacterium]|nr:putative sugar O-methyltransferase [Gammaproteobacteria bacterium]